MSAATGAPLDGASGAAARVAILVEDNKTFLLPAVERMVRELSAGSFRVSHLGVVPSKLGRYQGLRTGLWYLRVFGWWNTALLTLYSALEALRRVRARLGGERLSLTWLELAERSGMEACRAFDNPNDQDAIEFLRAGECDILFVMVPYILGPEVLQVPKVGAINKHAAILPGCRGLFPYIWGRLHGKPLGMTFHRVVAEVDAGPVLLRRYVEPDHPQGSMVEFYVWVYREFPALAVEAAWRLLRREEEPCAQTSPGDFHGLPRRADFVQFRQSGGRIIRIRDLSRSLTR
jgi:methionyl-tRNA formyltransferase